MEDKEKVVADNYTCADALEHFKQKYLDPLKERLDKNHDWIFGGGYDKQCKGANVDPDPKKVETLKAAYDDLSFRYNECKKVYDASFALVLRHEHVINVLAKIQVGLRDNILWKGECPAELMQEQQEMVTGYYRDLNKILATIKIEDNEKS